MILQREIIQKSREWQVPPDTVDKDYVLGHVLSVLTEWYTDELIFKGGTCLRKCYIADYRFSEDLDFTALKKEFVLESKALKGRLNTLISISDELKFLVGFFYFSGWKEIFQSLKDNEQISLKIVLSDEICQLYHLFTRKQLPLNLSPEFLSNL